MRQEESPRAGFAPQAATTVEETCISRLAKGPAQRRYIPTQKALHGGEFTGEEEGSALIGVSMACVAGWRRLAGCRHRESTDSTNTHAGRIE